jgi:hypothetical protein
MYVTIFIILSYLIGLCSGWSILSLFLFIKPLDSVTAKLTEGKDKEISNNIRDVRNHFNNLVWRSYGIFIAALTLIGAWFAGKLAFEPEVLKFIAPKSFICAILLIVVISISINMIWAAYISISLMVINRIIAKYDCLYMIILSHPLTIAYNSIFSFLIDTIFFVICLMTIIYYKELGYFQGEDNFLWNIFYYLTIVIFGVGSFLRLKARYFVYNELMNLNKL